MCHDVLQDPTFFRFLSKIDHEFAAETRAGRCPSCEGPLHVADYPRKPRGCPAAVREEYSRRLSFTCGRCDARSTSPSVRFAGRRVYLAVVLMLRSPAGSASGRQLCDQFTIPARTLKRWRTWWRQDFPSTPFWQSMRARFIPPLAIERLPQSALERFDGEATTDRLTQALRWIAPLSTRLRSGCPRLAV